MSDVLFAKLLAVRRKHLAVAIASGFAAAVGVLALVLATGMLLDWWFELSFTSRVVLLAVDVASVLAVLVVGALLPVIRAPDVEQAALWVERAEASFRSRLISAVQFSALEPAMVGASPAMVRALLQETESIAMPIDFTRVVKTDRLMLTAIAAGLVVIGVCVSCISAGSASLALLERALLVPGVDVPRRTRIECQTKNVTVGRGDAVTITAVASGRIPSSGAIGVEYGNGQIAEIPLDTLGGGRFGRTIENVQDSFLYTIALGDNHTEKFKVDVVARPAVVRIECVQVYPAYTHHAPENRRPGDLSLLAGSRLRIAVRASKPVKMTADAGGNHVHFYGGEVDYPLSVDANDPTRLAANDGVEASVPIPPGATGFSVELVDTFGLRSKEPVIYRINLLPDRPPSVRITYPEQKETKATAVARPSIGIEATDDFGIGKLAIRYHVVTAGQPPAAGNAAETVALELGGQTPSALKRRFVWDLGKLSPLLSVGDVIDFWAEAADTNDATGPGVTGSDHFQFRIVTDADKRAELMSKLGDYLGQINEVSESERDLNARLGTIIAAQPVERR